jgi:FkbM family methyltransferase
MADTLVRDVDPSPREDLDSAERRYARQNVERLRALVAAGREREDRVRFESTTPRFIQAARDARVLVDAGAEFGFYALLALREMRCPKRLHLLEPDPCRHGALSELFAEQPAVSVHAAALGAEAGQLTLHKAGLGFSATLDPAISEHVGRSSERSYQVPCLRLDDLCPTERIDLIKMDIEGAELLAFRGMRRIFREDRPRIFLEKHRKYIEAIDPHGVREMVQTLAEHDYLTFAVDGDRLQRVRDWIPGRALLCPRELLDEVDPRS